MAALGFAYLLKLFCFHYYMVEQFQSLLAIGIIIGTLIALEAAEIKFLQSAIPNELRLLADAVCRGAAQAHTLIELLSFDL